MKKTTRSDKIATKTGAKKTAKPVRLLAGDNPQIAKGYGNAPVQTYLAAIPGWKGKAARQIDALIVRIIPRIYKAVKWNTAFYGFEAEDGKGDWFIGFHCTVKYLKIAFFRGTLLNPMPPGESTQKEVRYLHVHENEEIDEPQFISWVTQASKLPGKRM
jgi:hypothetical protein